MGVVHCYSMDIYCDSGKYILNEVSQYAGRNYRECVRQAKADGWSLTMRCEGEIGCGYSLCPACNPRNKKAKEGQ